MRQLLNLIYIHLRDQAEHDEKCTARSCMSKCGYVRLDTAMKAPLLPSDFRDDQRAAALLRGEI